MTEYDWILLNMTEYDQIWLNLIEYDWIWANKPEYDLLWPYMIDYDWIWLNMTEYDWKWLIVLLHTFISTSQNGSISINIRCRSRHRHGADPYHRYTPLHMEYKFYILFYRLDLCVTYTILFHWESTSSSTQCCPSGTIR